jgi:hypothetical protein
MCIEAHAKAQRRKGLDGLVRETVGEAFDAVSNQRFSEIDEQAEPQSCETKIGENLLAVNRSELFAPLRLRVIPQ